jgi:hypothetical protein
MEISKLSNFNVFSFVPVCHLSCQKKKIASHPSVPYYPIPPIISTEVVTNLAFYNPRSSSFFQKNPKV